MEDKKQLPPVAYAISPFTKLPVRIYRGDTSFYGVHGDSVRALNEAAGVDAQQAAAMLGGVVYGWQSEHAKLDSYTPGGTYIGPPEKEVI